MIRYSFGLDYCSQLSLVDSIVAELHHPSKVLKIKKEFHLQNHCSTHGYSSHALISLVLLCMYVNFILNTGKSAPSVS